mmetsp:Transcript_10960/g.45577  ORF Transcript_10960/g.45577 Transcript_10960/m.45577 type:complete len:243 (+) Transcript_10960:209-937(+)
MSLSWTPAQYRSCLPASFACFRSAKLENKPCHSPHTASPHTSEAVKGHMHVYENFSLGVRTGCLPITPTPFNSATADSVLIRKCLRTSCTVRGDSFAITTLYPNTNVLSGGLLSSSSRKLCAAILIPSLTHSLAGDGLIGGNSSMEALSAFTPGGGGTSFNSSRILAASRYRSSRTAQLSSASRMAHRSLFLNSLISSRTSAASAKRSSWTSLSKYFSMDRICKTKKVVQHAPPPNIIRTIR